MKPLALRCQLFAGTLAMVGVAGAQTASRNATPADWSAAFGAPDSALHLVAQIQGRSGPQTLEFWRDAAGRVVRRSGTSVELRLNPSPDNEDAYQLRDLSKHTAYDVHRLNLYRIGLFTDRWSTQHLLDRPSGAYSLSAGKVQQTSFGPCTWVTVTPAAGPTTQACWSGVYGVPLIEQVAGREVLKVTALDTKTPLPSAELPAGWQDFDADEDIAPD